jgi:hypothetical protein
MSQTKTVALSTAAVVGLVLAVFASISVGNALVSEPEVATSPTHAPATGQSQPESYEPEPLNWGGVYTYIDGSSVSAAAPETWEDPVSGQSGLVKVTLTFFAPDGSMDVMTGKPNAYIEGALATVQQSAQVGNTVELVYAPALGAFGMAVWWTYDGQDAMFSGRLPSLTTDTVDSSSDQSVDGITEGIYLVGTDIEPGTYRSEGPTEAGTCFFFLEDESGGAIDSGGTRGPAVVTIRADAYMFETSYCQPWTAVE